MRFWARPSWEWAYIWALVVVVAPSFILAALNWRDDSGGPPRRWLLGLVQGADNRWSTSKTAIVLWTLAVWWALLAMLVHTHGNGFADQALEAQYLLLLGIPTTAAVAAKATHKGRKLTTTKTALKVNPKIEKSKLAEPTVDLVAGVGQLFADDTGMPDLLDTQYFGFTIILLLWFVAQFIADSGAGLPVLPQTLVGLSGVSAAGYAAKKALPPMNGTTTHTPG
jgi:hypothetical protein